MIHFRGGAPESGAGMGRRLELNPDPARGPVAPIAFLGQGGNWASGSGGEETRLAMLARAVENASDLIWFMDPENRFSQINDSRGRTIGFMGVAADLTNPPYSEDTGLAT